MKEFTVHSREEWREWLQKYHLVEEKVLLISYKRHTGKSFLPHQEQVKEAICFGWIDTTIKRIDENRFGRTFVKRKPTANWSKNTLQYAKELFEAGVMSSYGKQVYLQGKIKKPLDHGVPKVFTVPEDLMDAFNKNKKAKAVFDAYPPSAKKVHLKWLFLAKRPATRHKRIRQIIEAAAKGKKVW